MKSFLQFESDKSNKKSREIMLSGLKILAKVVAMEFVRDHMNNLFSSCEDIKQKDKIIGAKDDY